MYGLKVKIMQSKKKEYKIGLFNQGRTICLKMDNGFFAKPSLKRRMVVYRVDKN